MSPKTVGVYLLTAIGAMLVCNRPAAMLSDRYASQRRLIMLPAFFGSPS